MLAKLKVFYSYAHKDSDWYRRVRVHLHPLVQGGLVEDWSDEDLRAGEWSFEIMNRLDSADLILLLVTADYIASENCRIEYERAMERYELGRRGDRQGAIVIPIWLAPSDYEHSEFGKLQPFPSGYRPISQRPDPEEALRQVNLEVRDVIARLGGKDGNEKKLDGGNGKVRIADDDPASLLPHFCDRTQQEIDVKQLLDVDVDADSQVPGNSAINAPATRDRRSRPFVFIVRGRDVDCPEGFKLRLENDLLPRALNRTGAITPIPLGDWPSDFQSEESAKSEFQWRFASRLGCTPLRIAQALEPNSPTFICVRLEDDFWKRSGEQLMSAFLHFLEELPDLLPGQLLIVGVFIEYRSAADTPVRTLDKVFGRFFGRSTIERHSDRVSDGHADIEGGLAELTKAQSGRGVNAALLTRLNNIELRSALDWADDIKVRTHCLPNARLKVIEDIRAEFRASYERPMGELVEPFTHILTKYRKGGG